MAALCPRTAPTGALARLLSDRARYLAFLRRRVNPAAAEDILQSAYLRLLERGASVRDEGRLASWFYSVLRNATIDHARSDARHRRLCSTVAVQPEAIMTTGTDGADADAAHSLIAALDQIHREALEAVYVRGQSIADLAAAAAISHNAATVRLHRARRALSEIVGTRGRCRSTRSSPLATHVRD